MPGRSRRLAWALGIAALFLIFLAARFPYDRLLPRATTAAGAALGAEVTIASLGLGFGRGGPEAVARDLRLHWPGSLPLALERVAVRPAWSLDWLRGRPRWHLAAAGPPGRFDGTVAADRVDGRFAGIDVGALPWTALGASPPLDGPLSGSADLLATDGVWSGAIDLASEAGSVDFGGLPVAIPYQRLEGRILVDPARIELRGARLEGPMVTAAFEGTATPRPGPSSSWPLALDVRIEHVDPALRQHLVPLGIRLDREGRATLHVSGTLAAPILSPGA